MTTKIKLRYKKFILTYGTAISMVLLSNPMAINLVKKGAKTATSRVKMVINKKNLISTLATKVAFLLALTKPGKKACVKAPSPKSLLNKFGNLKAIKKISLQTPAPKIPAVRRSLKSPRILEVKIPALFVKNPAKTLFLVKLNYLYNLK